MVITSLTPTTSASVELLVLIFCLDDLFTMLPRPIDMVDPVWLFMSWCTANDVVMDIAWLMGHDVADLCDVVCCALVIVVPQIVVFVRRLLRGYEIFVVILPVSGFLQRVHYFISVSVGECQRLWEALFFSKLVDALDHVSGHWHFNPICAMNPLAACEADEVMGALIVSGGPKAYTSNRSFIHVVRVSSCDLRICTEFDSHVLIVVQLLPLALFRRGGL